MKITPIQKRFLIIWVIFHSFALFVNIFHIKGEYKNGPDRLGNEIKFAFTSLTYTNDFWPYTTYNHYERRIDTVKTIYNLYNNPPTPLFIDTKEYIDHYFNGIFNSYNYAEFIFYMILGFIIVYVPKLWKN